jgi:hypothetical protein
MRYVGGNGDDFTGADVVLTPTHLEHQRSRQHVGDLLALVSVLFGVGEPILTK